MFHQTGIGKSSECNIKQRWPQRVIVKVVPPDLMLTLSLRHLVSFRLQIKNEQLSDGCCAASSLNRMVRLWYRLIIITMKPSVARLVFQNSIFPTLKNPYNSVRLQIVSLNPPLVEKFRDREICTGTTVKSTNWSHHGWKYRIGIFSRRTAKTGKENPGEPGKNFEFYPSGPKCQRWHSAECRVVMLKSEIFSYR